MCLLHQFNHTAWLMQLSIVQGTSAVTIKFYGRINFTDNNCSSMYLVSSIASFDPSTDAIFDQNEGQDGGAIALIGFSSIQVRENSTFHFQKNKAMERVGAIFVTSINIISKRGCFLQYQGKYHKAKNVSFVFQNWEVYEKY